MATTSKIKHVKLLSSGRVSLRLNPQLQPGFIEVIESYLLEIRDSPTLKKEVDNVVMQELWEKLYSTRIYSYTLIIRRSEAAVLLKLWKQGSIKFEGLHQFLMMKLHQKLG